VTTTLLGVRHHGPGSARAVRAALADLSEREQSVLALRFGLEGQQPHTLEEVGAGLGITRERVRQLETRALRELRTVAPSLQFYLQQ
jgi:RNA polymerase sigma factor (sigma-70 family)